MTVKSPPTTPLGTRDRAIFEVLYSTGIRRAEVCSLDIDNIHVDRQVLFVYVRAEAIAFTLNNSSADGSHR